MSDIQKSDDHTVRIHLSLYVDRERPHERLVICR